MKSGVGPFLSFFILLLLGCSTAFAQGAKVSSENPAESERDRPQERAKWFMRGRMVDGKPGAEQLHRAYDQKLNNRRLQGLAWARAAQGTTGETTASPRPLFVTAPPNSPPWNFLGPAPTATAAFGSNQQNYGPVIGRVTAVAVDQGDTTGNTVYIGGASGGLWRTTNAVNAARTCDPATGVCTANVGWTPLTDGQATLTVGSIALSPANSDCPATSPTNCLILVGTGEANNSVDSYYGLGILRSTNGGTSWSLISQTANGAFNFHGLGFTHIAFASDRPNIVVATAAAAGGGIIVGAETGGSNARGIYFSTDAGVTWTRATVSDGATSPDPGSANAVIYNAQRQKFYANLRYHGVYSSSDGAAWTRLANQPANITLANCPSSPASGGCPLYRAEMAIVPGRDEMYVWIVGIDPVTSFEKDFGVFQTKDGGQTWNTISTTGIDSCGDFLGCGTGDGSQATYNITLAAVPNGGATDLYAGGINQYKCTINSATNPTCAASPFLNLTHVYGCSPAGNIAHVHPDEHGVDFLGNDGTGAFFTARPSFSPPVFFGNDGGIYRASQSSSLTNGTCPAPNTTPPSPFDNLSSSTAFSMIQFVGFSHHPSDPTTLVGGTQDNGSPAVSGASPSFLNWLSVNNGDGGFNAINPLNANEWFTSNPAPLTAGGGIQRCTNGIHCTFNPAASPPGFATVVSQNQILNDNSSFYTFFTLDPQASTRMLVGSCRVWRGNSDGSQSSSLGGNWSVLVMGIPSGGNPLSQNFDTGVSDSGATCASSTPFFVNTIAAGGPCNGPCNPGITPGSGTGGGSQVVWAGMEGIADATSAKSQCLPGNGNGVPCGGQVWVTTQADADLSTTPNKWTEVSGLGLAATPNVSAACTSTPSVCNINPKHYTISGIALDPNDATGKTAYVTVMGFGVGHIFKTTDAGAHWAKLDGNPNTTGLPDAPADAVVADPSVANLVYVGTDVGAFSSTGNGTWTELGPASGAGSLPNVTITLLKIYNNPSDSIPLRLRASTYGRGIWEISISPDAGFQLSVTPASATAIVGQTTTLNGTITLFNGYNSSISLFCQPVSGSLPSTCTPSPPTLAPGATTFTVTVGDSTANTFNFNIVAVGGDPKTVTQQFPVTLNSVSPFTLGAAANTSTPAGGAATTSFLVTASTAISGTINVSFACSGLPAASSCSFSLPVATLIAGQTASVDVTIQTAPTTAVGTYPIVITGTYSGFSQTTPTTLSVLTAPDFTMSAPSPATLNLSTTDTANTSFTLLPNSTLSGSVALACSGLPTTGASCVFNPSSPSLTAGQTTATPVTLTISLSGAAPGPYTVTVTSTSGAVQHTQSLTLNVAANSWGISAGVLSPNPGKPGQPLSGTVTITPSAYTGTVSLTCALSDSTGTSCGFSLPSSPTTIVTTLPLSFIPATSSTAQTVNVVVTTTAATPATNLMLTVTAQDATTSKSHTFNYSVIDYALTAGLPAAVIPNGASGSTQVPITIAPLNGFTATVNVTCTGPSGSGVGCSLNPPGPNFPINGSISVPLTTATISGPNCTNSANSCGGSYTITIATSDSIVSHSKTFSLPVLDFSMMQTTTTGSVTAGNSGRYTINVAPGAAGATGPVTLSCTSGVPQLGACQFGATNASSITLDPTSGQISAALTITTTAPSVSQLRLPASRRTVPLYALWLTMPGIVIGLIGVGIAPRNRRGKLLGYIGLVTVLGILLMLASCGGGGGGTTTTPPIPKPGTPAGTYQITVTGASGSGATSLSHNTMITLTVQ